MAAVAVSPAPVKRRKRNPTRYDQGKGDDRACDCRICRGERKWPRYYVGLWILMPLRSSPPTDWTVRWVSYECALERLSPPDADEKFPPTTEREAMDAGLTVRDPGRRSIHAPLMSGECEACGELRQARYRFCLGCAAKVRIACRDCGWDGDLIARYLMAPVNGHDEFAEGTIEIVRA